MCWLILSTLNLSLTPPPPSHPTTLDPTVLAAIITATVALIAAIISAAVAIYQTRRNAKLEKEKNDSQIAAQNAQLTAQLEIEREKIRLQTLQADQERQRQRQEMDNETARIAVEQAQTKQERIYAYREAICADPRIAQLQILDMSHPLDVDHIFIRVRLHRETKAPYEIDPLLLEAEASRDPNALLKAHRKYLETRTSAALDPEDAIRTYKRCVLVGDPGAGKTTLLKYLALKAARQQLNALPDFPIHIELNAFAASRYSDILEFISTRWDDRYGFPKAEARACIEEYLQAGTALLLLDALDETAIGDTLEQAEASYEHIVDAINQLASRYHQTSIVVTVRKASYQQHTRLPGFTELEVLDFRPEDIEQFIDSWFAHANKSNKPIDATDLKNKLARNTRLQALAANPLLLCLIVIVYEDQLDLPDRRAELYKLCVDILLNKWDASRGIKRLREFKPEYKRGLLQEIAWHFHNLGQRYIPESDLLNVIANFLPVVGLQREQNLRVLEEITSENGLLKEQARHWYGFLHLTLQEYFAALYAITDPAHVDTLLQHRHDPWWEEIILLYAGSSPDASILFQKLLEPSDSDLPSDDIFYSNLVLAGRCLASRPTLRKVELRERIIKRLFQILRSISSYSFMQNRAASTLAEIGGSRVNAQLIRLLCDEQLDRDMRERIVEALGELGERTIAPELIRLLSDKQLGLFLRCWIAEALGELGERSIASELVHLLSDQQLDSGVRENVARALGKLGESAIAHKLVSLLDDKQLDSGVQEWIAEALGELGELSIAPELMHLLSDQQLDPYLRSRIAEALGKLGERSIAPELVNLLSDKQLDSRVQEGIAYALGELGDRLVVPEMVRLFSDKQLDPGVRERIAEALGMLGEGTIAPALVRLFNDEQLDIDAQRRIADVLGELGERSIIPELVCLLSDRQLHSNVRWSIARALGKLEERSIAPDLVRLLSDEQLDTNARSGIADALEKLVDDIRSVHELASLLDTSDMPDAIYSTLWTISQRMNIQIYKLDTGNYKIIHLDEQT